MTSHRDIDSTPPATTTSCAPLAIPVAATVMACCPEPQNRLSVMPGNGFRPAGEQHRQPSDVVAVIAGQDAVARDDVLDAGGVESAAGRQSGQALREQRLWVDRVQSAVRTAFAARSADDVDYPRVDEELLSLRGRDENHVLMSRSTSMTIFENAFSDARGATMTFRSIMPARAVQSLSMASTTATGAVRLSPWKCGPMPQTTTRPGICRICSAHCGVLGDRDRRPADQGDGRSGQPDVQGLHLRQGPGAARDPQQPAAAAAQPEAATRRRPTRRSSPSVRWTRSPPSCRS